MQKILFIVFLTVLIFVYSNCTKKTEAITNPADDDTTGGNVVVRKPNIYIYPQHETTLEIQLKFPNGGEIIESLPEYNIGWNVTVKPSGLIDSQYDYLFYEAQIPQILQKDFGWKVNGAQLDSFFTNNLYSMSFSLNEIGDFIDYWIPLLDETTTYTIYPQFNKDLDDIIQFDFSIKPDNLIRVWYLIEEYNGNLDIEEPVIPVYQRQGFVILEWGVVI